MKEKSWKESEDSYDNFGFVYFRKELIKKKKVFDSIDDDEI